MNEHFDRAMAVDDDADLAGAFTFVDDSQANDLNPLIAKVEEVLVDRSYSPTATRVVYSMIPQLTVLLGRAEKRGREAMAKEVTDWLAMGGTEEVHKRMKQMKPRDPGSKGAWR